MLRNWKRTFCFLYLNVVNLALGFGGFDFSSIGNKILDAGIGLYDGAVCNFKECCTKKEIPADFDKLERLLEERIYGQHIAQEIVVNALRAHWNEHYQAPKALTLSFHGWPGGGKNYITNFIVDSLYARGSSSRHVHYFVGWVHFPLHGNLREMQTNIYNWIKGNVTRCPKQIFIFDEVDKMAEEVLNIIKPMIDYNRHVENVDYRKAIFIFLSNTGQGLINDVVIDHWSRGEQRENIKLEDFEPLISRGAFNEKGGFHHSDTIKSNLIDHYVPFLPLEKRHIEMCVKFEFKQRGVPYPTKEHVDALVLHFIEWGPAEKPVFSLTGCKRLSQKVGVYAQKYYLKTEL